MSAVCGPAEWRRGQMAHSPARAIRSQSTNGMNEQAFRMAICKARLFPDCMTAAAIANQAFKKWVLAMGSDLHSFEDPVQFLNAAAGKGDRPA